MTVTPESFRLVMGEFATGITVVTTLDPDGHPYGVTVNSFTSVSLEPRLILVCLDRQLNGLWYFEKAEKFGVNVLGEDQVATSVHFSMPGSDRTDHSYIQGRTGVPLLAEALAHLECDLVENYRGGDHRILLGEVIRAETMPVAKKPLIFFRGNYTGLDGRKTPEREPAPAGSETI